MPGPLPWLSISCFRASRIPAFGLRPVSKVNFCALKNPWQWSRLDAERPRVLRCYAAKKTTRERSTKRHRSLPELCGRTFQPQRSERFGARSRGIVQGYRSLLIQRMSPGDPTFILGFVVTLSTTPWREPRLQIWKTFLRDAWCRPKREGTPVTNFGSVVALQKRIPVLPANE